LGDARVIESAVLAVDCGADQAARLAASGADAPIDVGTGHESFDLQSTREKAPTKAGAPPPGNGCRPTRVRMHSADARWQGARPYEEQQGSRSMRWSQHQRERDGGPGFQRELVAAAKVERG